MTKQLPIVKVWYGPEPHQFFYCDAGLLDEAPETYASSPEEWRRRNPDVTPAEAAALTAEMREYEIVPGTH